MSLNISPKLSLPPEAAVWSIAELAIRGAGKTYAASVFAEELIKNGIPIIVIDGLGVWWGLGVGVNGNPGLPVVVFGGAHKHISIPTKLSKKGVMVVDEDKLKLMVKAILEARMNAILDTSEFSKGMQRRIVAAFVSELYRLNAPYGVRHVFIEEADLWCPQKISGDVALSAGAIDDLVRRGGNFNLGCTLITQRSAVLNKDVLSQASTLVVMRILHRLDKQAVQGWVESVAHPDDPRIKKWYDSLAGLKNGEAWVWHPESPEIFERIQFRKRTTLHATREYFLQSKFEQKDIQMTDVEAFIQKFKKVFEPQPILPTKQMGPLRMRQEPKPVMPIKPLDTMPLSPSKPMLIERHRDQGLGPEFQREWNKVEDEMDGIGEEPRPIKRDVGSFSMRVTQLISDSLEGKIIYLIKHHGQLRQYEIIDIAAAQYGWQLFQSDVSKTLKDMVNNGLLTIKGSEKNREYAFPEQNRVEEVPS